MDKRYQVFVSSTYADLKEERQRVIQTVMELDCIPAGMELFPAADEEQFEFIKRVIDDCDYYLLIIGGRYGSTTDAGISYTELEYEYAISKGIRVIALLHENPDDIVLSKSEKDPGLREKLNRFREKVATGRLVKFWKTAEDLPGLVSLSLSKTIKTFPAVGWIRANKAVSEDVLSEVNELRKENARLLTSVSERSIKPHAAIENLAALDEEIELHGVYSQRNGNIGGYREQEIKVKVSWQQIFWYISPYLAKFPNDSSVKSTLAEAIFHGYRFPTLNSQDFQTVSIQFKALGLVDIKYLKTTSGGMDHFWSLTPAGERLMLDIRAVRSNH